MELLQNWIETFGVIITAFATIALAWVTTTLARETKRLAAISQSPQVVVTIEPSKRTMFWLEMHVENAGTASAFDIELDFSPPLLIKGRDLPLTRISVLKPRQMISTSFCNYAEIRNKRFNITTRWALLPGGTKRESLSYVFDAKSLEGMSRLGDLPEVEIAKSVKKLSDDIGRIASGFHKLAVDVYTNSDREAAEKEREEWLRAQMEPDTEPAVPSSDLINAQTAATLKAESPSETNLAAPLEDSTTVQQ